MKDIQRILVSRMKFIGDVVLTTPILRSLRKRYPDAFIAYLAESRAASLLEQNPCLDEIIPFDFSRPALIEQPRIMWLLRRRRFDVFIDLFCNPRTALLALASGAPMRIGKEVKGRGRFYTHRIVDDGLPKSAIAFHYQYLQPLGITPSFWRTDIVLSDDEKKAARQYLQWQGFDTALPIVGLHPGATWPAKMWPWERFADLIDLLRARLGVQIFVTQGPRDGTIISKIEQRSTGSFVALPVLPLRQLAAVVSHCAVYAANDNGTMHISVATRVPTIGIFGPGEDDIWFPYGSPHYDPAEGHIALRRDVPCHPCHLDFCNKPGEEFMKCMNLLGVGDVFDQIALRVRSRSSAGMPV